MLTQKWAAAAALLIVVMLAGGSYMWHTSGKIGYTEVFAAYGESMHIKLPDGSAVWLNSGTTLRFPEKFTGSQRNVFLEGEAHFTIAKDSAKPFTVNTEHLAVNVLGTIFNLKAYPDDAAIVATLESGKIGIIMPNGHSQVLAPGQQLSFNHRTSQINLRQISGEEASAWKYGNLIFTEMNMGEILTILSRRYNLIPVHPPLDADTEYTVKFTKDESIEDILSVLSEMSHYTLLREGDTITVVPR